MWWRGRWKILTDRHSLLLGRCLERDVSQRPVRGILVWPDIARQSACTSHCCQGTLSSNHTLVCLSSWETQITLVSNESTDKQGSLRTIPTGSTSFDHPNRSTSGCSTNSGRHWPRTASETPESCLTHYHQWWVGIGVPPQLHMLSRLILKKPTLDPSMLSHVVPIEGTQTGCQQAVASPSPFDRSPSGTSICISMQPFHRDRPFEGNMLWS